MKQVLQSLRDGRTYIAPVPAPSCGKGQILVRTARSLISPGTERMLVEFGRGSLIAKARSQPERVRQVLNKIKTDGLWPTLEAVRAKLDEPLPLGYCNAGTVLRCGDDATARDFPIGCRVASNGWHAEYVAVGRNLAARIPDNVSDDEAAFTVMGAIALQGIRLAAPTLGETVLVMGLGPVGLMAVQLLRANGCRVLATDFSPQRLALAQSFGAQTLDLNVTSDAVPFAMDLTNGRGADAVLIAAATESDDPIRQAAKLCRPRGRVVLVGVAGLHLDRTEFFKKEITLQVSCSYGPGRYDEDYESGRRDYPIGHARWTAQRNFEAVLQQMAEKRLDVTPLITHRYAIAKAAEAYASVMQDKSALGVLLEYTDISLSRKRADILTRRDTTAPDNGAVRVALVGSGNFARRVLLPLLAKEHCSMVAIASARGVSAATAAKEFGFREVTTDSARLLADPRVNTVVIATRHNQHADQAAAALAAGKHVFVEKPLAITLAGLAQVVRTLEQAKRPSQLCVGFNRRYSPAIAEMGEFFRARRGPLCMEYTVNAGAVPADSWLHDPEVGGGRVVGEVCHFLDTLAHLAGAPWQNLTAESVGRSPDGIRDDKVTITLRFADGSIGTVHYWANGPGNLPKERLVAMADGAAAEMTNFRRLSFYRDGRQRDRRFLTQDKGHGAEVKAFLAAIRTGRPVIEVEEIVSTTLASFAAREALVTGERQTRAQWLERLGEAIGEVTP